MSATLGQWLVLVQPVILSHKKCLYLSQHSQCGSIEGRSRQRGWGLLDHGVGWEQQGVQEAREGEEAGGTPSVPRMIFEYH